MSRPSGLALALLVALPSEAKERDGVVAPPTIEVEGRQLHLIGMGLRKKLWIRVYLASLYLEQPTESAEQAIGSDQIKQVRMNMLRDLDRGKIVEAVQEGFQRNAGPHMPQLQGRLDQFLANVPDLKGGETIVITYRPGR